MQTNSNRQIALVGLIALLPAVFIELVGVSAFAAPENAVYAAMARWTADPEVLRAFNLIAPAIMLGGAVLAFVFNLLSFVRFSLRQETGELIVTARIRGSFLNLAILALSLLVTAVLLWYAFVENFAPR